MSELRDFSRGFRCPVCGHNKIWHYGEGGACETRVVPDEGCYDYASLEKCGCPGPNPTYGQLIWACENPECLAVFAEYINGCPFCYEKGLHFSVRQQEAAL